MRAPLLVILIFWFCGAVVSQPLEGNQVKLDSLTGSGSIPGAAAGFGIIYSLGSTGLYYVTTGAGTVRLLGVLSTSSPSVGQVPQYKTGNTIEWESLPIVGVNFQAGELIYGITADDSVQGVTKVPRSLFLASNAAGAPYWLQGLRERVRSKIG